MDWATLYIVKNNRKPVTVAIVYGGEKCQRILTYTKEKLLIKY